MPDRDDHRRHLHLVRNDPDDEPDPVYYEIAMFLLSAVEQVRTEGWETCDLGFWKRFARERVERGGHSYDDLSQMMTAIDLMAGMADAIPNWPSVYRATQQETSRRYQHEAGLVRADGEDPPVPIVETPEFRGGAQGVT